MFQPALQVVLLLDIGIAKSNDAAADKTGLLDMFPMRILQAGQADARRGRSDTEVMAQGVLRVQVPRHHRFSQTLQPTAQRGGQGAAPHASVDRHQRNHTGAPLGLRGRYSVILRGKGGAIIHGNAAKKVQS